MLEGFRDPGTYIFPAQPSESASQWRDCNRVNIVQPDFFDECAKACLDILHPTFAAPMSLRREVDDEPRICERTGLKDEHSTGLNFVSPTGCGVRFEILGEGFLELERNTAPHDADAVHRIDEGVDFFIENIAGLVLNHDP